MKRKLNYVLLFLLTIALLPLGVKAEETYSIEMKMLKGESSHFYNLDAKLKGMTGEDSYYVKFVNKGDAKPTDGTYENLIQNSNTSVSDITKWKSVATDGDIAIDDDYYLLAGYDYAYVAKCTTSSNTCTVSDGAIQVANQDTLSFGDRYSWRVVSGYDKTRGKLTDGNYIYLQAYFPRDGKNGDHKVAMKVGKVTDQTVINKIAKKEADATEKLLAYAKKASDKSYVDDYKGQSGYNHSIDDLNPDFNAYYYFYVTFTDANNLYRTTGIEDVYFGKFNDSGSFYVDTGSYGNATASVKQTSSKVENPKTSDANIFIMIGVLFGTLGILGVAYKKFKKA